MPPHTSSRKPTSPFSATRSHHVLAGSAHDAELGCCGGHAGTSGPGPVPGQACGLPPAGSWTRRRCPFSSCSPPERLEFAPHRCRRARSPVCRFRRLAPCRRRLRTMGKRSPLGRALGFSRQPPEQGGGRHGGLGPGRLRHRRPGLPDHPRGAPAALFPARRECPAARLPWTLPSRPSCSASPWFMPMRAAGSRTCHRKSCPMSSISTPCTQPVKSPALSGKAMQLAQQLAGKDEDTGELLQVALTSARRRVVVRAPYPRRSHCRPAARFRNHRQKRPVTTSTWPHETAMKRSCSPTTAIPTTRAF